MRRFLLGLGVVALLTGGAVALFLLASPYSVERTIKLSVVRVGELATHVYDPRRGEEGPVCNCSTDWRYRCDPPELAYFERVRRDPRVAHFYREPRNDFETYVSYMHFLREAFPHGRHSREFSDPAYMTGLNLIEMLDDVDAGESFLCGNISKMLIQMIQAGGGYARMVALGVENRGLHRTIEAWVPELGKWVMLDPDYDVYFSGADGIPLSASELHDLARAGRADEATAHPGSSANTLYEPGRHDYLVGLYENMALQRRADWVSAAYPYAHPKRHPTTDAAIYHGQEPAPAWAWLRAETAESDPARLYFEPCRPGAEASEAP